LINTKVRLREPRALPGREIGEEFAKALAVESYHGQACCTLG
jgi:hypothetical protein